MEELRCRRLTGGLARLHVRFHFVFPHVLRYGRAGPERGRSMRELCRAALHFGADWGKTYQIMHYLFRGRVIRPHQQQSFQDHCVMSHSSMCRSRAFIMHATVLCQINVFIQDIIQQKQICTHQQHDKCQHDTSGSLSVQSNQHVWRTCADNASWTQKKNDERVWPCVGVHVTD